MPVSSCTNRRPAKGTVIAYSLDIVADEDVLRVRVVGTVDDATVPRHAADVERITSAGKMNGCRGILLDVRGATVELRSATRISNFMAFTELIPQGMRLAAVGVADPQYRQGFSALLAGARGLVYRPFDDDAEALAWLRKAD